MIQNLKLKRCKKKESNNTNNFNNYNENSGFHKRLEGLGSKIIFPRFARVALHIQHGGIIVHVNFWFRIAYHCFERKVVFTFMYTCKYLP